MAESDFNLTKLKTNLTAGARPSLFEFVLYSDGSFTTDQSFDNINLFCQVSALPPLTVTPIEKLYKGRTVKIPGDMVFGDLTTTVYQTEAGTERLAIEQWMDNINGHVSNLSSIQAWSGHSASLYQYNRAGDEIMAVDFTGIWPQSISEIALSYDTASDIEQYDITWSYQHYEVYGSATSLPAAAKSLQ